MQLDSRCLSRPQRIKPSIRSRLLQFIYTHVEDCTTQFGDSCENSETQHKYCVHDSGVCVLQFQALPNSVSFRSLKSGLVYIVISISYVPTRTRLIIWGKHYAVIVRLQQITRIQHALVLRGCIATNWAVLEYFRAQFRVSCYQKRLTVSGFSFPSNCAFLQPYTCLDKAVCRPSISITRRTRASIRLNVSLRKLTRSVCSNCCVVAPYNLSFHESISRSRALSAGSKSNPARPPAVPSRLVMTFAPSGVLDHAPPRPQPAGAVFSARVFSKSVFWRLSALEGSSHVRHGVYRRPVVLLTSKMSHHEPFGFSVRLCVRLGPNVCAQIEASSGPDEACFR